MYYKPDMLWPITSSKESKLESKHTLVLVQFERMKTRSSIHHWELMCRRTGRFRAQDDDLLSLPECQ